MKKILLILFFASFLFGSPFDYYYLYKANSLEKDGKQNEALYNYNQIKDKSDEVKYNIGNLYYKEKNYKKAVESYSKISQEDKNLTFKTLHNLGNSYAKMGQIDEAIKSYEKALKIEKDQDTLYNLELLKKKKEETKNKQDQQKDQEKNDPKNDEKQEQKDTQNKNESNKENQDQNKSTENNKENKKQEAIKQEKKQNQARKAAELSDLEEKKWSQMLENRDIKTLVVPISNSGEKNEQNIKPW